MATTEVSRPNPAQRATGFYHEVVAEMRKVTWPDVQQVRQLSIGVIVLTLSIGGVIALLDVTLQQILVRGIPSLFAGR